jgi:hypothetical protein
MSWRTATSSSSVSGGSPKSSGLGTWQSAIAVVVHCRPHGRVAIEPQGIRESDAPLVQSESQYLSHCAINTASGCQSSLRFATRSSSRSRLAALHARFAFRQHIGAIHVVPRQPRRGYQVQGGLKHIPSQEREAADGGEDGHC